MKDLSVHPDARRLKREIANLRSRLAEAFEETLRLEEIEAPALRARYHDRLGPFQLEVLELRFENAAIERKIERLLDLKRRGVPVTRTRLTTIDRQVARALEDWREDIHAKEERIHESRRQLHRKSSRNEAHAEHCGRLYRRLCLALHPALGAQRREDFEAWWHAIEKAYTRYDVEYLEIIAFALEIDVDGERAHTLDPEEVSLGGLERLRRERDRLGPRLDEEYRTHDSLRERPPLSYRELLDDERALDEKRRALQRRAASLRARRDRLRSTLDSTSPVASTEALGGPLEIEPALEPSAAREPARMGPQNLNESRRG